MVAVVDGRLVTCLFDADTEGWHGGLSPDAVRWAANFAAAVPDVDGWFAAVADRGGLVDLCQAVVVGL